MPTPKRRHWGLLLVMVLLCALIYWLASDRRQPRSSSTPPAVAVSTAQARVTDVAITITELGAAQAWRAVTIRTQVNGRLQEVAVQEGQRSKRAT